MSVVGVVDDTNDSDSGSGSDAIKVLEAQIAALKEAAAAAAAAKKRASKEVAPKEAASKEPTTSKVDDKPPSQNLAGVKNPWIDPSRVPSARPAGKPVYTDPYQCSPELLADTNYRQLYAPNPVTGSSTIPCIKGNLEPNDDGNTYTYYLMRPGYCCTANSDEEMYAAGEFGTDNVSWLWEEQDRIAYYKAKERADRTGEVLPCLTMRPSYSLLSGHYERCKDTVLKKLYGSVQHRLIPVGNVIRDDDRDVQVVPASIFDALKVPSVVAPPVVATKAKDADVAAEDKKDTPKKKTPTTTKKTTTTAATKRKAAEVDDDEDDDDGSSSATEIDEDYNEEVSASDDDEDEEDEIEDDSDGDGKLSGSDEDMTESGSSDDEDSDDDSDDDKKHTPKKPAVTSKKAQQSASKPVTIAKPKKAPVKNNDDNAAVVLTGASKPGVVAAANGTAKRQPAPKLTTQSGTASNKRTSSAVQVPPKKPQPSPAVDLLDVPNSPYSQQPSHTGSEKSKAIEVYQAQMHRLPACLNLTDDLVYATTSAHPYQNDSLTSVTKQVLGNPAVLLPMNILANKSLTSTKEDKEAVVKIRESCMKKKKDVVLKLWNAAGDALPEIKTARKRPAAAAAVITEADVDDAAIEDDSQLPAPKARAQPQKKTKLAVDAAAAVTSSPTTAPNTKKRTAAAVEAVDKELPKAKIAANGNANKSETEETLLDELLQFQRREYTESVAEKKRQSLHEHFGGVDIDHYADMLAGWWAMCVINGSRVTMSVENYTGEACDPITQQCPVVLRQFIHARATELFFAKWVPLIRRMRTHETSASSLASDL